MARLRTHKGIKGSKCIKAIWRLMKSVCVSDAGPFLYFKNADDLLQNTHVHTQAGFLTSLQKKQKEVFFGGFFLNYFFMQKRLIFFLTNINTLW